MKRMKLILAVALLSFGATVRAQSAFPQTETTYEFQKHWFLDLEGGAQYTLGEAKFRRMIRPNVQVAFGRQFSPAIAARLQVNGWQSRGGWNTEFNRAYTYKYVAPGVDVMFNLSNILYGFNPKRFFSLSAFVGAGANIGFNNDEVNDIFNDMRARGLNTSLYNLEYVWDGTQVLPFGRAGLEAQFRLSDAVAIVLEGNANILSDKYNSKKAENADWYFNALAGLRINLGKTHTKTERQIIPANPWGNQPARTDTVYITRTLKDTVYVDRVPESMRRDVFFTINKWEIRSTESQKVADIASYLQRNPKARVTLTGYADVQTGNNSINDNLGVQRANAVKQELISRYGIAESRITTDAKGSREQPFPVNEQNRVTIAICE